MAREIPVVNRVVGTFVNPVVNSLDMDGIIQHIDVNEVIDRIDIERILDRVDMDRLLARVDVNALAQRLDFDALADNLHIGREVERQVASVVSGTAGAMAVSALDRARQELVSVDTLTCYAAIRTVRRIRIPGVDPDGNVANRPAGPFTRLLSFVIDSSVVAAIFSLGVAMTSYIVGLFTHHTFHPQHEGFWWAVVGAIVALLYYWTTWALWGMTVGQALLGLRVIHYGGGRVGRRSALRRTLVFPFSFILGLGFIEVVFGRERRAWHDHAAKTQVVYDWGGRAARLHGGVMTWLASRQQLPGRDPSA